ncbi:hypothetical protein [Rhodanobacter sp. C05]|uniref:hypothetical protein n=1 Tax=Rhodanobacter sp. C05 TaxID=1945855 RepID=UPI0009862C9C|nr:hypothetical protein [Rhodanobacter sp. C05]OOG40804.1 hypothetical protein B0E51_09315 [Rhodanobacter sp. C05]
MKRNRSTEAAAPPPSPFERIVKRVAGIGVIVSLLLGLFQAVKLVHDAKDRMAHVDELARLAQIQSERDEPAAAWAGLGQAIELTSAAGPLESSLWAVDRRRKGLQAQQEDVAMQWLRDARPGPGHAFSDIVDPVAPVLERAAADATGQRRADLLAHLGWARFLKSRDGSSSVDPARDYASALAADAHNAYAHAFWGHWILWQHGDLTTASRHFADALTDTRAASGPTRAYVRTLQIAALRNAHATPTDAALLALVNTMRIDGEPIDAATRDSVKDVYYDFGRDQQRTAALLQAAPPAEQAATLAQLAFDEPAMRAVLAQLLEASGQRVDALRAWRALRADPAVGGEIVEQADTAIRRLTTPASAAPLPKQKKH